MGLFSYINDRKEEAKNSEYRKEGYSLASAYKGPARAYLNRNYRPTKEPKYRTVTKEPTPEERARLEEEHRKKEEAERKIREQDSKPRQDFYGDARFSMASDSVDLFADEYGHFYRTQEELAEYNLLETAKRYICEARMPGMDVPFIVKVHQIMEKKNLSPADIYRRAQIDKTTFSKLSNDLNATPTKDTAVALALGLELNLQEATDLIRRAGYAFSHSSKKDIILEYFFDNKIYNVVTVNCILDDLGLKPLGRNLY